MEFFVIVENVEFAPNSDDEMVICDKEGYFIDFNKTQERVDQLNKLYCDTKKALKQEITEEDETHYGFIPLELHKEL